MEKQVVNVDEQEIAVYRNGDSGPDLLFIHGNSSSAQTFQNQLESPLAQKYRLAAIDLPGHGESAAAANPDEAYTLPGYAKMLIGVAQALEMTDAVFVGWSLGGHVVLEAADRLPAAPGFVIFGAPPLGKPPLMDQAFMPHPAMRYGFMAKLTPIQMAAYTRAFVKAGENTPDFFLEDMKRSDGQARETLSASVEEANFRDEVEIVANLEKPLAILHGEREQLVSAAYISQLTMPTLWRGDVQLIAQAGHAPHWEQPEDFNALLDEFVQDTAV